MSGLRACVRLRAGSLALDVDLTAGDGEVVALVGPNGAGKTTLLRAIAGLAPVDAAHVEIDGRVVHDTATGVDVPPERRGVGLVFQDHLLFPHLSALENVAFGLRARGVPRAEARERAAEWLARVGLAAHAGQRARALSGGQSQRVALARALAVDPALVLLDEPLAALDASTRLETRHTLRELLAAHPGAHVVVTHDVVDAAALGDRIVVLEAGRIVQDGTLQAIAAQPRSPYVADLVGVNLLRGTAGDGHVRLDTGFVLAVPGAGAGAVFAVVHPRAVALHRARPEGSPRNVWQATIASVDAAGAQARIRLAGPLPLVAEVTRDGLAALGAHPGDTVWASVKATEVVVYPQ